jgi:hypothetical protein
LVSDRWRISYKRWWQNSDGIEEVQKAFGALCEVERAAAGTVGSAGGIKLQPLTTHGLLLPHLSDLFAIAFIKVPYSVDFRVTEVLGPNKVASNVIRLDAAGFKVRSDWPFLGERFAQNAT